MFKVIVLCSLYNLSDDQVEYQIRDRHSFMRFLGLGLEGRVPDAKPVWLYRDRLAAVGVIEALFNDFDGYLKDQGYLAMGGQIIDASIVAVPTQHNSRDENITIKAGETPEDWADSAYRSAHIEEMLKSKGLVSRIHRKGHRHTHLSKREQQDNKTSSKVRVRVEHIFGSQSNDMGGTLVRSIGIVRAKARIGLKNLTYNMRRLVQLQRLAVMPPCPNQG